MVGAAAPRDHIAAAREGSLDDVLDETLGQQTLSFVEVGADADVYEYSVLATSLDEELLVLASCIAIAAIARYFRRVEDQWGWGGFVTQDLARCQLAARLVALFYDWWTSSFVWSSRPAY